ncbi:hypothetical protein C0J52_01334 [Blattella germanica]|nr:hypothetical protein C0J52_01334 [Blattella germanica]
MSAHPDIFKIISVLRNIQLETRLKINGMHLQANKKRKVENKEKKIEDYIKKYREGQISRIAFTRGRLNLTLNVCQNTTNKRNFNYIGRKQNCNALPNDIKVKRTLIDFTLYEIDDYFNQIKNNNTIDM